MEKDVYDLETKGLCLFCLRECSHKTGADKDSEEVKAFKFLMRYLQVDILKLRNFSSSLLTSTEDPVIDTSMVVSLCEKCDEVVKKFQEFFMYNETIRLRMDECVRRIHDEISSAQNDLERKKEYEKRINTRNPMDLLSASIVENLRKETIKKCSLKISKTIPRVVVAKGTKRKLSSPLPSQNPVFSPPFVEGHKTATSTPEISQGDDDDEIRVLGVVPKVAKTVDTRLPMNTCSPPVFLSDPSSLVEVVWNSPTPNSSPGSFPLPEFGTTQVNIPSPWTPAPSPAPTPGPMEEGGDDLVFKCPICDRLFQSESGLSDCMRAHNLNMETVNKHAEMITQETNSNGKTSIVKLLVCKLCRKICKTHYEFLQHYESTHAENNVTVTCKHCGIIYTEIFAFRKHVMMEHKEVFFSQVLSRHLPPGTTEQDFRIAVTHVAETMRLDPKCKAPYGCPQSSCNDARFANRQEMEVHVIVYHFDLVRTKFIEDFQAKNVLMASPPTSSYSMNPSSNHQFMQQVQASSNHQSIQQVQSSPNHQSTQQTQSSSTHQYMQQIPPSSNQQPSNYSMQPSNYFPPPNNSYVSQPQSSNPQFQPPRPHQNLPPPPYRAPQMPQQSSTYSQPQQPNQSYRPGSHQSYSQQQSQALVHYRQQQPISNVPTSQYSQQYINTQHNTASQLSSQPNPGHFRPQQIVQTHNSSQHLQHQTSSGHRAPQPNSYNIHNQGVAAKTIDQINQLSQFVSNVNSTGHVQQYPPNWPMGNNISQTQIRHSMPNYQGNQNQVPPAMQHQMTHMTYIANITNHSNPQYQGHSHNNPSQHSQLQQHSQFTMQNQIQAQPSNQLQRYQTQTPPHRSQTSPHRSQVSPHRPQISPQPLPSPQSQVPTQSMPPPPPPQAPVISQPPFPIQMPAKPQPPPLVQASVQPTLAPPPVVAQTQPPPPPQASPASQPTPPQQAPPKPQPPPPQQAPPKPLPPPVRQVPNSRPLPLGLIKIDTLSEYD